MTGDEEEVKEVQKFLKEKLDDFVPLPIPSSWFMFSLFLRKLNRDILTMKECKFIAERLKVQDLSLTLWFLHRFIGIPLHYDEGELSDLVICNPQVVFNSISEIVIDGLKMSDTIGVQNDFDEKGMFRFGDIQESFDKRKERVKRGHSTVETNTLCISPAQLIQILELHNFITLVVCEMKQVQKTTAKPHKNNIYFMPARLPFASDNELKVTCKPTDPAPLIVCFKYGIIPIGVFCATNCSFSINGMEACKANQGRE